MGGRPRLDEGALGGVGHALDQPEEVRQEPHRVLLHVRQQSCGGNVEQKNGELSHVIPVEIPIFSSHGVNPGKGGGKRPPFCFDLDVDGALKF